MIKPAVHLYTLCWDEADMLGFFFRHYDPWVDRYVVFDDGSTDGSLEILRAHPKVELRTFERAYADSFCLSHQALQDDVWKESRGRADWVVVTAIDEHLHVRGCPMATYLADQAARGVTLLPALGFDMNHPTMPDDEGLLIERVTRGRPRIAFNKLSVFNPDAVLETGFGAGRHEAVPVGDLKLPGRDTLMLWHYKHLGFERNAAREADQAARLGSIDAEKGLGDHYRRSKDALRSFWDDMERDSTDLARTDFVPDRVCVRPLWWSERAEMTRVRARAEGAARVAPTVSVLVKTFNHERYIRQTIESVLAQSFQDFEVVVTDDGSTDTTPSILRGFDDARIDLCINDRNLGISGAMNATLARARGRYVAILNSDDWALPDRLERQVTFLDSNPQVGLVFGMPRPVDDTGAPTLAYNDFRTPLHFPDFARATWLRYFFSNGNCLCAPTAMIRREAYQVGLYDRRLTNLQDFDMWIRMLVAGHTIHVLPDELTAFRIRDNQANMSAARLDTHIRCNFEARKILDRFLALDAADFDALFGHEAQESLGLPVAQRLALLALRHEAPAHKLFALETLYDTAVDDESFDRLRALTGSVDPFGAAAWHQSDAADAGTPMTVEYAPRSWSQRIRNAQPPSSPTIRPAPQNIRSTRQRCAADRRSKPSSPSPSSPTI